MIRERSKEHDFDKVYADKAHGNRSTVNMSDDLNIEQAIQIRMNASIKTKVSIKKRLSFLIKKLGYKRRKQLYDRVRRWIAVIVFSSLKR